MPEKDTLTVARAFLLRQQGLTLPEVAEKIAYGGKSPVDSLEYVLRAASERHGLDTPEKVAEWAKNVLREHNRIKAELLLSESLHSPNPNPRALLFLARAAKTLDPKAPKEQESADESKIPPEMVPPWDREPPKRK